jgi:hypothetical protein
MLPTTYEAPSQTTLTTRRTAFEIAVATATHVRHTLEPIYDVPRHTYPHTVDTQRQTAALAADIPRQTLENTVWRQVNVARLHREVPFQIVAETAVTPDHVRTATYRTAVTAGEPMDVQQDDHIPTQHAATHEQQTTLADHVAVAQGTMPEFQIHAIAAPILPMTYTRLLNSAVHSHETPFAAGNMTDVHHQVHAA